MRWMDDFESFSKIASASASAAAAIAVAALVSKQWNDVDDV